MASDFLNLEKSIVVSTLVSTGNWAQLLARATRALHCWAISPAPGIGFFIQWQNRTLLEQCSSSHWHMKSLPLIRSPWTGNSLSGNLVLCSPDLQENSYHNWQTWGCRGDSDGQCLTHKHEDRALLLRTCNKAGCAGMASVCPALGKQTGRSLGLAQSASPRLNDRNKVRATEEHTQ